MASQDEVTVSSTQGFGRQVTQVATLLETKRQAKITAINLAIPSAVNLVELIKHRVKGIYQHNLFERVENSNKTRVVFLLSLDPLDVNHKGYQAPIPESEVIEKSLDEIKNPPPKPEGEVPREPRRWENKPREEHKQGSSEARPHRGGYRAPRGDRSERVEREGGERHERGERSERRGRGEGRGRGRGEGRGHGRGEGRGGSFRRGRGGFGGERGSRAPEAEKYIRAPRPQEETKRADNEIFVSVKGTPNFFLREALLLLKKAGKRTIIIKASGSAIPKAVKLAEEIKGYELGLYQLNSFNKRKVQVLYQAREEGLQDITQERDLEGLEITLSKDALDSSLPGYQAPLPAKDVKSISIEEVEKLR